ncbi:hypothetical protein H4R18_005936 [Coemansia javaensis]|uniref:Thioredoxin domain-containing protein n=1 Tax=Coemansia javaensis TaxID=2761396 RepID=A0A9W8H125_9FUNG|nr:hypothetical protein H4R18_005936 [Coemansia javaensis]
MRCIRVDEPAEFDRLVAEALTESRDVFVLFFGREQAGTGVSWCPDCVIADPLVRRAIAKVEGSILLEVPVDPRSNTASPAHIFRERGDVQLGCVPTLLRWTAAGPSQRRLVEDECREERIDAFVAETSAWHAPGRVRNVPRQ